MGTNIALDIGNRQLLGKILYEADILGFTLDSSLGGATYVCRPLLLPEDAEVLHTSVAELQFLGVGRLLARRVDGFGRNRTVVPLSLQELTELVDTLAGAAYLDDPFAAELDIPEDSAGLSLMWTDGPPGPNTFDFFIEGSCELDVRLWFHELRCKGALGQPLDLRAVASAVDRWWAAMRKGDARTHERGIFSGPTQE
jgi:hypothetical protein